MGSYSTTAPCVATFREIGQESAKAIVGMGNRHSWRCGGWKRARRIIKPGGLILPKGRTQSMGNSPYVLRSVMNPNGEENIRARCKVCYPQVSTCSGRHLFKELRVIL